MPKEKSISHFSSNLCFCVSVITLYASRLVSAGVRTGTSMGLSFPSTRNWGGDPLLRCRSEPPDCITFCNISASVTIDICLLLVQHRFPEHFVQGCESGLDFCQPALAQGDHSLFDCLALD